MSRVKLIVGNWKMNGSFAANTTLLSALTALPAVKIVVAPPFVYLASSYAQLMDSTIELAAQNVAAEAQQGAYTGEVSALMLAELCAKYVIVGHSERRQYYGETDALVAQKCLRLQEAGLKPIICVGETLAEREAGQVEMVVSRVNVPRKGDNVTVYYNPKDKSDIIVE